MDNENISIRGEIIKILCDTNIFPPGISGFSWDFADIIKPLISDESFRKAKDFKNSVREALETMYGHPGCKDYRKVERVNVSPPKDKKIYRSYVVFYTLR